jgi:NADH-quinone oxidoreductase subunit C
MSTVERVTAALAGIQHEISAPRDGTCTISVAAADLHACVERLQRAAGFETNTFVTAVDRFPAAPRFQLVYQFLSVEHNDRVRVTTSVGGEDPRIATITDLYPGTAYSERECFDMFGIVFTGHVGLKRLLMPADYDHFPLRKDFPHQGIEPDRLYREWNRKRRERPVNREFAEGGS